MVYETENCKPKLCETPEDILLAGCWNVSGGGVLGVRHTFPQLVLQHLADPAQSASTWHTFEHQQLSLDGGHSPAL